MGSRFLVGYGNMRDAAALSETDSEHERLKSPLPRPKHSLGCLEKKSTVYGIDKECRRRIY